MFYSYKLIELNKKMKKIILLLLIALCSVCYAQKAKKELKKLEGIWIAEDYYNSFEKTKSAVKSKKAFGFWDPVGLRINTKEIKKGKLNIGYSILHDHLLYPEVSSFIIKDNDTIREQGNFTINLDKKDSLSYYKTTEIDYFSYKWVSYLKWNAKDDSFILYRPKGKKHKEKSIRFKRVKSGFEANYLFPNPIYYYTRFKTLVGNYSIKDSSGNMLSDNFRINENGIGNGFEKFENFTFYFSTDVYCGLPYKADLIVVNEDILNDNSKGFSFLIDIKKNGDIHLNKRKTNYENESVELGEKVYELIKK